MMSIQFENPIYLFGLFILPFIVIAHFYLLKFKKRKAMKFANFDTLKRLDEHWIFSKNILQLILRLIFCLLIVLAFSGLIVGYNTIGSDYDIVFSVDVSGSMLAKDLTPKRIDVVKESLADFIDTISIGGRTGLVSFGGMAFILQPLTDDLALVESKIGGLSISTIPGTAIGDSIKTGVNMLITDGNENPDMIILITDGQENVLKTEEFLSIGDYAVDHNIVVNIIGVGTLEGSPTEVLQAGDFQLNEETVVRMSEITNGRYIKAESKEEIIEYLGEFIEPHEIIRTLRFSTLLFALAMMVLFVEWNFSNYIFRAFP